MPGQPESKAPPVRQVPGVIFSPLRRRARILGSGLEVFEIIGPYRLVGQNLDALREWFHWLTEDQLRAALAFAQANPEFVNAEIEEAESIRLEDLWEQYPATKPKHLR